MKHLLYLGLLLLALPAQAAVDDKFSYAYPPVEQLPYSLGYQYSTFDLRETDVEGWKVMELTEPVTLTYQVISEAEGEKAVEVVFDPSYLELKDVLIPEKVVGPDGTEYTVTTIGKMAFDDCPKIRSVIMGNSITRIEDYAFNMCENKTLHDIGVIKFSENLTHIGNYAFRNCHNLTTGHFTEGNQWKLEKIDFVSNVDYPIYGYGGRLTGLENYLLLPASVNYIGQHAFEGCYFVKYDEQGRMFPYGLSKVKIPNPSCVIDDYAFAGCQFLELITIGEELTAAGLKVPNPSTTEKGRIGDYAFANCNLMRLDIPSSIESIGEYAFSNCFKTSTDHTYHSTGGRVYFDNLKMFYPRSLFHNHESWWASWEIGSLLDEGKVRCEKYLNEWHTNIVTIYSDNMTIGRNSFANNPQLAKVIFNGTVNEIASSTFKDCGALTEISLPDGLTKINSSAFMNCTELTGVTIPDNVTEIGDSTFYGCEKMTTIHLPASLENVNPYTFHGCKLLNLSGLPEGVQTIGNNAFQGCHEINEFNIPDKVTSIGEYAFADCYVHATLRVPGGSHKLMYGLKQVTIGNGVKTIGAHAFDGCRHLGSITMGENVASIGDYAFSNCMSCPENYCDAASEEVVLPNSLTSIGLGAFQGCSHMPGVRLGDAITSLPDYAFAYCSELAAVEGISHVDTVEENTFVGCYSLEDFGNLYADQGNLEDGIIYNEDYTEVISALPSIEEAIIRPGVTGIREGAFSGCGRLYLLEIPESVVSIGSRAFENCISLETAELRDIEMGDFVYAGCTGIFSVTIAADFVRPINDNWFYGCYNMEKIEVEPGNEMYSSYYGILYDSECKTLLRAPSAIYDIEFPETVTTIGDYAFSNCIRFEFVYIPSSVTRIGAHAFDSCYEQDSDGEYFGGLNYVSFDNPAIQIGDYAFNNCKNLEQVEWFADDSVEPVGTIGKYAFNGCESLLINKEYFNLEDASIRAVEPYAFAGFTNMSSIAFPATLETIGDYAFDGCVKLEDVEFQDGLTKIGNCAFRSSAIKSLASLPNSIVEIGDSAFMNCANVMELRIPEGLKEIKPYTFYKCFSGTQYDSKPTEGFNPHVVIPDEVESIGEYAFYGAAVNSNKYYGESGHSYSNLYSYYDYGLLSVTIGNKVSEIGAHAFDGCTHLMELKLGNAVTKIGDYAFRDCFKETFNGVRRVELTLMGSFESKFLNEVDWEFDKFTPVGLTLPEGLTSLGEYAFSGCAEVPSLTIPASLSEIPYQAFYGCSKIPEIILPEGVTTIGDEAFAGCKGVEKICIPASLESGRRTFVDCDNAFDVYYYAEDPKAFDEAFFSPKVYASKQAVANAPNAKLEDIKGKTPWALFYKIDAKDDILVHLERALETKNGLRFRILSNKPTPYCEVAGPAEASTGPVTYVVPTSVINTDETSDYYNMEYQVIRIGNDAFENDLNLVGIDIPPSVYDIGQEAFNGCKNLPEITLPESIKNIGERAFANCAALTYFVVPPLVTRLNAGVLQDCRGLYSIRMHDDIEELGIASLMDCRHLRAFERSENWKLRVIDDYALKNCIELEVINIPEGVTKIGKEAMYYCQKLNTASLPTTLREIGENVFDDCEVLKTIKVYTETTPKIRGEANLTEPHCKIYVQAKCLDDYKRLWSVHESRILPGIFATQPTREQMPEYILGNTHTIPVEMPLDGQAMTWSSGNPVVASPAPQHDGTIMLNAVGRSAIHVQTDQKYYHDCVLDVYPQRADANWDANLNIADVVNIATYALQNPEGLVNWYGTKRTDMSEEEWNHFYNVSSDLNGDSSISVSDASAAVKLVLDLNPSGVAPKKVASKQGGTQEPVDALIVGAPVGKTVPVGLDNSKEYVALEANIRVPEGVTIEGVSLGARAATHTLMTRRIDDRTMRFVLFDLSGAPFAPGFEALVELTLGGRDLKASDVEIFDIVASDAASAASELTSRSGSVMSGIGGVENAAVGRVTTTADGVVITEAEGLPVNVYSVDGRLIRSISSASAVETLKLLPGVYLVKIENYTVKVAI